MRLLIITLLFYSGITSSSAQQNITLPTKNSIKKFEFKPGVQETFLRMSNGAKWPIMVSFPKKPDLDSLTVILALHWGVATSDYQDFMNCLILPSIDHSKYMVIAPLAEKQVWWKDPKASQLSRLLRLIRTHWPVRNIVVVGYSDGGTGAVYFAENQPKLVDASIAVAGYYKEAQYQIPTYVIHSVQDELFNYEISRAIIEQNKKNSSEVVFVSSPTLSHFEACGYVDVLQEAFHWVDERLDN